MRIRIITFGLNIPPEAYTAHTMHIAPEFNAWPGLLGKWWLGDTSAGTYGGVYLFASQHDADRSRETDLFRGMYTDPALKDVTVREYDVLDAPTQLTAPVPHPVFGTPGATPLTAVPANANAMDARTPPTNLAPGPPGSHPPFAVQPTAFGDALNSATNATVVLRQATADDREALRRFLTGLSQLSSFQRFFTGAARTRERDLGVLLGGDRPGSAIIATSGPDIVSHAMWAPVTAAPGTGEVGLVVADHHRRRGIGTGLLRAVVADARRAGVRTLEGLVLPRNETMHRLIRDLVPDVAAEVDGDLMRYRIALTEYVARAA